MPHIWSIKLERDDSPIRRKYCKCAAACHAGRAPVTMPPLNFSSTAQANSSVAQAKTFGSTWAEEAKATAGAALRSASEEASELRQLLRDGLDGMRGENDER